MYRSPATINDRKIRIALVGCGRIAAKHFEAIGKHKDNLELVGICDSDQKVLDAKQIEYSVPAFSHLTALLENTEADLITLATPSGLHPHQTIECARAGRHVMTEKPMATRYSDGKAMVKACDDAGVELFVIKQNRLNSTLQLLKRAITDGRFGRIFMVNVNVFWTRPQEYYDNASWRGTWEFDGGALMNQASHYIDLLDWLIGPIESVHGFIGTLARNIEVEDSGVANIKWRSGALGSVNVTMLTYPKNLEGSIAIMGERGTVKVGGVAVNEIEHWEFADQKDYDQHAQNSSYETSSVYGFGHPLYYDNVIQTLRGEARAATNGREGLRSLETLIAIYKSARDGVRVSLPLDY